MSGNYCRLVEGNCYLNVEGHFRGKSFLVDVDMRSEGHWVEVGDLLGNFHQVVVDRGCNQHLKYFLDLADCMMLLAMGTCFLELLLPHCIRHAVVC